MRHDRRYVSIDGLNLTALSFSGVIEHVFASLSAGEGGWILTANLHYVYLSRSSTEHRNLFRRASLLVADGLPLMWLSRIQGESLPERVSGADLVWALAERAAELRARIAFLGDSSSTSARAKVVLESTFPGLVISGTVSPNLHQQPTKDELEEIGDFVTTTRADIVYVALGVPNQDEVIAALQSRHPSVWWIGVGGSLKFVAGSIRRAPRWMQGFGLEWLYRLQQEPLRLWKRYLIQDMPTFLSLLGNALRTRWNREYSQPRGLD